MDALTMRDFRSNMASSFNTVDAGGRVLIRRNNRLYTIVSVDSLEEDDHVPNDVTEKAILEAMALSKSNLKNVGSVDTSSVEAMLKSCGI